MLHTRLPLSETNASASQLPLTSLDGVPNKSKGAIRLRNALTTYATIEFFTVACSAYFIGLFYYGIFLNSWRTDLKYILSAILIATLVLLTSLGFRSFVEIRRQPRHIFLWRGAAAVVVAFSIFLSIIFVAKESDGYSRVTFILQSFGVGFIVMSMRVLFYSWLHTAIASNRMEARRVVLIGEDSDCSMFADRLKTSGIQAVGFFGLPKRRGTEAIRKMIADIRPLRTDDIIVLANNEFMPKMFALATTLAEIPAGIHIVPVDALNIFTASRITELGNLRTIQAYPPPLSRFDLLLKRSFDLITAAIGLVVVTPLFLVVSVAIKLDTPGPIFFRQTRHGFNNEEIRVFKFRSMTEDGGQFKQAIEKDPRVTGIGHIIRRTNIDELPQLINVLLGDMSIVGPRPHPTELNAFFHPLITPFSRRHTVKPGITGWAQINGYRGATDTVEKMELRIEYDLHYVDNWSLLFDIKIIAMTLFSKRAYTNAY